MNKYLSSKVMECNIAHALSNEERLTILQMLLNCKELSVSQIQAELYLEQSTVSHHLGFLKNTGLLTANRVGRIRNYRISDDYNEILSNIFHLLQEK